jgi:hypothetical protein
VNAAREPQLLLGLNDLRGLQLLVEMYLVYLRREMSGSVTPVATIQTLLEIRQRLVSARLLGGDPVRIPLKQLEWRVLNAAIVGVHQLLSERAPASAERDDLLTMLEHLRQEIARMIALALD